VSYARLHIGSGHHDCASIVWLVFRVYHGGTLDPGSLGSLWVTPDLAAAFAQLHKGALWQLTLDVADGEVLDLRRCGLDVAAVARRLMRAGMVASVEASDARHPMTVVGRVKPETIRAAGYRVVRLREWNDWGASERHAEWLLIVDMTAVVDRELLPLPGGNRQFPNDYDAKPRRRAGLVCPRCDDTRGDVVTVDGDRIAFRCDGCGYHWSS
jgi:hypothetical protein